MTTGDDRWRGCPLPTTEDELIKLLKWANAYGGRVESTWYQVTDTDGTIWMQTSDVTEALEAVNGAAQGRTLQRMYRLSRSTPWQAWTPDHCDQHAIYDPECIGCVEADAYCPHGNLLRHTGDHVGESCWRPSLPNEDKYLDWIQDGRP